MKADAFYNWMIRNGYDTSTSRARTSNCVRICEFEGDLDLHCEKDSCRNLINKLTYSTLDKSEKRSPKHSVPINGDIYNGTATLKQAVRLYLSFHDSVSKVNLQNEELSITKVQSNNILKSKKGEWPEWSMLGESEVLHLAMISTKYYRFLNPDIIAAVAEDNEKHGTAWKSALADKGINPELYLWNHSPCAFPGVRRHAGSKEIASHKGQIDLDKSDTKQALKLDDNDFPKEIWSFIFRGKRFAKFGPKGYALAHLIDHKEYKNRMKDELCFENDQELNDPLYGLYTCPSNTIYIPENIIKPTDFNGRLRQLLFRKMSELYKNSCNVLPEYIKVPQNDSKEWGISCFEWAEPVGDLNNIREFLEYRRNVIERLLHG